MKKIRFFRISMLIGLILIILLYIGKREQINNMLSPSNVSVEIKNSIFQFDNLSLKDTLIHNFYIKNLSNKELLIESVSTDCGCTVVEFDKSPIVKNDSAKVTVMFIPDSIGVVEKNIVVEANTVPPYSVFTIKGDVHN